MACNTNADEPRRLARELTSENGIADLLLGIGRDLAGRLGEPYRSADHGDLLYDKQGLPT